jgi:hypothetical protein
MTQEENELFFREEENPARPVKTDPVNHPSHYCLGGIEVLDAVEAWKLPYHLGNVVKYVARAGKKNPNQLPSRLLQVSSK